MPSISPQAGDIYNRGVKLVGLDRLDEAEVCFRRALEIKPDFAEAHANLGVVLINHGRLEEAVASCLCALEIKPDFAEAHSNLAVALSDLASEGHHAAAVESARAWVRICPENPTANHILAALSADGEPVPARASDDYVVALFDGFADQFDTVLAALSYKAPTLIAEMLARELPSGTYAVLDAGCGTGLAGKLLRPWARSLVGVDLSGAMLAQASERGLYDHLHQSELTSFLDVRPVTFDLIAAIDVLCYFGDLVPLFTAAATALCPGGWLAFSVEEPLGGIRDDWRLQPHGRYCHRESYLRRSLAATGLEPIHFARNILRSEAEQDVNGFVVLARLLQEAHHP